MFILSSWGKLVCCSQQMQTFIWIYLNIAVKGLNNQLPDLNSFTWFLGSFHPNSSKSSTGFEGTPTVERRMFLRLRPCQSFPQSTLFLLS